MKIGTLDITSFLVDPSSVDMLAWQPVQTSEQTNDLVFEMDCKKVVLTSGLRLNYIVLCLT